MADLLLAIAVVFGVNLMPAFGPPTWAVLVFFRLSFDVPAVPLVAFGALAAASGRLALAHGSRHFRSRMSAERLDSLQALEDELTASRTRSFAGLGLFALSPVPSAQLFVGAGLLRVPLLPLTAAFFAGRLVSYSLYVGAASAAEDSLGTVFEDVLTSPTGIALQLALLAALVALVKVDWRKLIARRRAARS